ncbi:hypothetical protein AMD27_16900 (plasmid) [Acinetobacter sp. TGL-Y2]|uniref:DNA sulfur modification protein DndB n=1 Tax=Acinetobacter sp. TGL-Y2 TaxID=1407071 RepID=UPI0007A671FF|nr:DNA sulfur modification protein DndB [Acinetobacter sp. TGL-Y2]AMW80595.1 hypothetical protein AMD27_16900 [Acinetobacter sp. TGL-Y2]
MENFYSFTALRGIQGRKMSYIIQIPLNMVGTLFEQEDFSLPVIERKQRMLNKARVNQIAKYLVDNPDSYVLPPLVAQIIGEVEQTPDQLQRDIVTLKIKMGSKLQILDGQHRCAGIQLALQQRKYLGDEVIQVKLLICGNLSDSQQVFADININAVKPPQSIKMLYNHRDYLTSFSKVLIEQIPVFKNNTDYERTNLPPQSDNIFTFSAIYQANKELLKTSSDETMFDQKTLIQFWNTVASVMTDWDGQKNAGELREQSISVHAVTLSALAEVGRTLIEKFPSEWPEILNGLVGIDWNRSNPDWKDRAVVTGKITKSRKNIELTANKILQYLGVALNKAQKNRETEFLKNI